MRAVKMLCALTLLLVGGCDQLWRSMYLSSNDRDIQKATKAIETARDDVHRAAGYVERGSAYSDRARYSRAFKIISTDEYERLFRLAIKDHDQSIVLDPASAEASYKRGHAYYDRAGLEDRKDAKPWLDLAAADFEKAIEKDPRHYLALDRLGLVYLMAEDPDKAIPVFEREMALNPMGRARLADTYCNRGSSNFREKKFDAAIADFEKSIEIGSNADGCSCEPYNPLVTLYADEKKQYDKAWDVVHKGKKSRKWIASEVLEKLKRDSGRGD